MEYQEPLQGFSAGIAVMAVGDPDSGLTDAEKEVVAQTILSSFQEDPEAAVQWELMRVASSSDDERTVHDLTVADMREICEKIFAAIDAGLIPNPVDVAMADHGQWLPQGDPARQDIIVFNNFALTMPERLMKAGILHEDGQAKDEFYVALQGMLLNLQNTLEGAHFHAEAAMLESAIGVVMRVYAVHRRAKDTLN